MSNVEVGFILFIFISYNNKKMIVEFTLAVFKIVCFQSTLSLRIDRLSK